MMRKLDPDLVVELLVMLAILRGAWRRRDTCEVAATR